MRRRCAAGVAAAAALGNAPNTQLHYKRTRSSCGASGDLALTSPQLGARRTADEEESERRDASHHHRAARLDHPAGFAVLSVVTSCVPLVMKTFCGRSVFSRNHCGAGKARLQIVTSAAAPCLLGH
ncbi:hypothetical protein MRX96_032648 [Rhipicephalus microplus]